MTIWVVNSMIRYVLDLCTLNSIFCLNMFVICLYSDPTGLCISISFFILPYLVLSSIKQNQNKKQRVTIYNILFSCLVSSSSTVAAAAPPRPQAISFFFVPSLDLLSLLPSPISDCRSTLQRYFSLSSSYLTLVCDLMPAG